jgi:hypothetical protein
LASFGGIRENIGAFVVQGDAGLASSGKQLTVWRTAPSGSATLPSGSSPALLATL